MSQPPAAPPLVVHNVRVFDGITDQVSEVRSVCVKNGLIVEEGSAGPDAVMIDGGGRVLMPGLSDAHVHLFAAAATMPEMLLAPTGVLYYKALAEAGRMLMRGFTTVRDMGGDSACLRQVIDGGLFPGPRIYPSQAAISQTSGHGDFSDVHQASALFGGTPSRAEALSFMRVVDGRERVLTAVREQLKRGATQIKLMAGGGVTSAYDPLDTLQFTADELRAAVEAAADWGTYVSVHVFTDEGIRRAVEAGVRSIEHGLLADEETIAMLAAEDVWLSTQPLLESDHTFANPDSVAKNRQVCDGVGDTLARARAHGVKLAFGTDFLLDPAESHKQGEMLTRLTTRFGFTPTEALKIATSGNAELFRLAGERDPYRHAPLGVIRPGAWADFLIVNGDPTKDITLLADPETNLALIVKNGRIHKNQLS
ncbi:amidohydrolase family protein [Streptomyces sp. TLI_171]|uniref:metal-dependent hydrolase family protein n=1 Tax=Streptomyces sp. TLI_171 TaxID=1938859 RepID=UPI000C18144B|nr:amidohydrolase family protein [Streptomyces sp. TLI_171]RKE23573.1 imidazolonepropionase-like amidohydrolase [Streptomyces sp. TLI_171]